jgi:hypothetical protein
VRAASKSYLFGPPETGEGEVYAEGYP